MNDNTWMFDQLDVLYSRERHPHPFPIRVTPVVLNACFKKTSLHWDPTCNEFEDTTNI
jgi:hypothetical protein